MIVPPRHFSSTIAFVPNLRHETERFLTAWLAVRQIVQAANFNRFHQAGVSTTQFMVLNVIPSAGLSLSYLARKLNLSPATLNETVNSLVARKLVERLPDAHDRRKVRIVATVEGQALQNSTSEEFHGAMNDLFGRMSILGISTKTTEFHKRALRDSTGLRTAAELTRYAITNGFIAL